MVQEARYLHLIRQDCPVEAGTLTYQYCRDSGGEDQDESVAQQQAVALEYVTAYDLVMENIYADEERRGSTIEKSTGLKAMLGDIFRRFPHIENAKKREALPKPLFAVLFWKFNRVSRDEDFRKLVRAEIAMRGGVLIELVGEPSTGNRMVDGVLALVDDVKQASALDEMSGDIKRGLAANVGLRDTDPHFRAQNPKWPTCDGRYLSLAPGTPPKGFCGERVTVGIKERKRKNSTEREVHTLQRWVPDQRDNLWERCGLAWKMRLEEKPIAEIHAATHLFKTTGGYTTFFSNRIYMGDFEYSPGHVYHDFVPALVTAAEFERVQARIRERAKKLKGVPMAPEFEPRRVVSRGLVSGLLFCGEVDGEEHPMNADSVSANAKRSQWDFYICTRKKSSHNERCSASRVSAHALEEAVVQKMMTEIITHENLRPIADELMTALTAQNADVTSQMKALKTQLDKVERAIETLLDAIEEDDGSGRASLKVRLKQREAEKLKLSTDIAHLKGRMAKKEDIPTMTDAQLDENIALIHQGLMGEDVELVRRLIRRVVAKIVIKGETGTIYYTFPFQDLSRHGTVPPSIPEMNHFLVLTSMIRSDLLN